MPRWSAPLTCGSPGHRIGRRSHDRAVAQLCSARSGGRCGRASLTDGSYGPVGSGARSGWADRSADRAAPARLTVLQPVLPGRRDTVARYRLLAGVSSWLRSCMTAQIQAGPLRRDSRSGSMRVTPPSAARPSRSARAAFAYRASGRSDRRYRPVGWSRAMSANRPVGRRAGPRSFKAGRHSAAGGFRVLVTGGGPLVSRVQVSLSRSCNARWLVRAAGGTADLTQTI